MKRLIVALTLSVAGLATQHRAPISADEVTLRHRIYGDGRVTIFLLDNPPGQATVLHRHDRDMLSVFVNGGRTRYFPALKLLYTSDEIQRQRDGSFFMPEFLLEVRDMIRREHLDVERVFGMHIGPTPWPEIDAAIAKASAR